MALTFCWLQVFVGPNFRHLGPNFLTDKIVVANFLCEVICCSGTVRIQINDQGREFENEVSYHMHQIMKVEQRIKSAYYPQLNEF